MIEVRGLYKRYGERVVLKGVDLRVEKGERLVVIGPTGAGKTTLLRLLDLLEVPSGGEILWDGLPVTGRRHRREVRRRIGMVFQRPAVFARTVYENVAYGLKVRGEREVRARVLEALELVGLGGYESRDARTLSGGEVQRLAIARAMVTRPEVLLFDEPTANLDPVSKERVEDLMARVMDLYGATVVMATHDMVQARRFAHRIVFMFQGEVLQVGTPQEVFNSPANRYVAELVGMENVLEGEVESEEGGMSVVRVEGQRIWAASELPVGERAFVCIRPEDIVLSLSEHRSTARNSLRGVIARAVPLGAVVRLQVDCGGVPLSVLVTKQSVQELGLQEGREVVASFKATAVHLLRR